MRKSYYIIVGLFVYSGFNFAWIARTPEEIERRNRHFQLQEAKEFLDAQDKYYSIMRKELLTHGLPSYEDACFDALINEGFSRNMLLGYTIGLYIKDLKRVAELSSKINGATMRCVLMHLCLQKDTGVMLKEISDEENRRCIMPIAALDITSAREYLPEQIMNSIHPGSYELKSFLIDQLYKKLPR